MLLNENKSNKEMFLELYSFLLKYDHNINKLCNRRYLEYDSISSYRDELAEILDSDVAKIRVMFNSIFKNWLLNIEEFCIWWMNFIIEYEDIKLSKKEQECYYTLISNIIKTHSPISNMSKLSEIIKLIFRITSINKNINDFLKISNEKNNYNRKKIIDELDILFSTADWLFLSDYWYSDNGIYQETIINLYENLLECIRCKEKNILNSDEFENKNVVDAIQDIIKNSYLHYQMKLTAYDRIFPNEQYTKLPNMFRKIDNILQSIKDKPNMNKDLIKFL